jgi:hypothetical protein
LPEHVLCYSKHEGLDGSCSWSTFTTSSMCASGMLCIGPPDVPTIRPLKISCVLRGHVEQGKVTAENKGKAVASTCASPELLVHVPGVS